MKEYYYELYAMVKLFEAPYEFSSSGIIKGKNATDAYNKVVELIKSMNNQYAFQIRNFRKV